MDSRMAELERARVARAERRRASTLDELAEYMAVERFTCEGGCDRELPVEQAAVKQPGAGLTVCRECFDEYARAELVALGLAS